MAEEAFYDEEVDLARAEKFCARSGGEKVVGFEFDRDFSEEIDIC